MRTFRVVMLLLAVSIVPAQPLLAQVNLQYYGQYSGQYRGQFSGRYSGRYYGAGSADQIVPQNRKARYENPFGYPVNSGACGELYYPAPGTDYVLHDRQGRRCY
jgi:hypothetical protein